MATFRVLKLGTECRDKATDLVGTVTHWIMNMGEKVEYLFQPKGLDEEGQPLKKLFLCVERLLVADDSFEVVDVPVEILGSQVSNKASGFKGMAIAFIRHINGCFHVEIQPPGLLLQKGMPISSNDFDLRECEGDMIPVMSPVQLKESQEVEPSPQSIPKRRSYK